MIEQKITPHLWFDKQAEEAAEYYVSVFGKNSGIDLVTRFSDEGQEIHGMEEGTVMTVNFRLRGQSFVALNGGPLFKFNEAVSFVVNCEGQEEVDYFWDKLSAHPEAEQCGWLKDKFGLSWQIVPVGWEHMLRDEDEEKVRRVTRAMLQMKKLDLKALEGAYNGNRETANTK
ncbi:MAG: VOC family protein [Balneolaceae bacterium]